jgi:hypothetical protein
MNASQTSQMFKVYAVIGGFDYEGENFKSLRLFDCFSSAVAYQKHLEENEGFDYAILDTREVCLESAIAA